MPRRILSLLVAACCLGAASMAVEQREAALVSRATGLEAREDWPGAGAYWESAAQSAEMAGERDRAIAHTERALAAWRRVEGPDGLDRQAFAFGVMSKLDLEQGRLTRGRERNLAALRIIDARIVATAGRSVRAGEPAPAAVPPTLLAAWLRAQRDTANWLDAQGRTVEAVELLTAAQASVREVADADLDGLRFYYRKSVSTRASMLKFLGFEEQALADFSELEASRRPQDAQAEMPQRLNLQYFNSQFHGPRPEYLDAARALLREAEAAGNHVRATRRLVAKMAFAYGEAGENVRDLESVIAEAREAGAELEAIYAQRDLAIFGRKLGKREGVEAALRDSLLGLRQRGLKRGEPALYREYGNFLVQDGRAAEGLAMLREAVRMTRAFGWTQHLPRLLASVASAQGLLADGRGLAQTLAEIDLLLARGALLPPREFLARCARARALLLLGRAAEAEAEISRATALADRTGMTAYQRFALDWTREVQPIAGAAPALAGSADLQPAAIIATAPPGELARARFRLSNASAHATAGTLAVHGRGVRMHMDEAAGVASIESDPAGANIDAVAPVQLGAGEELRIAVAGAAASRERSLRFTWTSGEKTAHALCRIQPETARTGDPAGAVVTNTSLAFENPFYAVHLHHPFRGVTGAASFRVVPSRRCRIEILDASTGALLAVDADGDGAFSCRGDSTASDADADGFPDLPAAADGTGEIEVLVFPLVGFPPGGSDTRIEVQTRTPGGWAATAHDILKPPRPR